MCAARRSRHRGYLRELEAKRDFSRSSKRPQADAILASNTSSLKLADIGANFRILRPGRIHFFNPVPQLQLVEVVKGANTDAKSQEAALRSGSTSCRCRSGLAGFLVNRVLGPYIDQALRCTRACGGDIDAAAVAFASDGSIELADTVGLGHLSRRGKELAGITRVPKKLADWSPWASSPKTGQGFYS